MVIFEFFGEVVSGVVLMCDEVCVMISDVFDVFGISFELFL